MKFIINIFKTHGAMAFIALSLFSASCNKELPSAVPIVTVLPAGNTIADLINTDTIYSYLKLAVTRVGLLSALGERSSTFTVFAPTNAAFRLSGIPDTNVIRALPLTSLTPLIQYHVIGGQALGTSTFQLLPPRISRSQQAWYFQLHF